MRVQTVHLRLVLHFCHPEWRFARRLAIQGGGTDARARSAQVRTARVGAAPARAREVATFEVEFIDAHHQMARAEELDVWVERASPEEAATAAAAAAANANDGSSRPTSPATTADATEGGQQTERAVAALKSEALARSGGRIEVGARPLIMREGAELASAFLTVLRPGELVKVLELRDDLHVDGKLRAKVEQVEEEAAARAIADSWWSPYDPMGAGGDEDLLGLDFPTSRLTLTSRSSASAAQATNRSIGTHRSDASFAPLRPSPRRPTRPPRRRRRRRREEEMARAREGGGAHRRSRRRRRRSRRRQNGPV